MQATSTNGIGSPAPSRSSSDVTEGVSSEPSHWLPRLSGVSVSAELSSTFPDTQLQPAAQLACQAPLHETSSSSKPSASEPFRCRASPSCAAYTSGAMGPAMLATAKPTVCATSSETSGSALMTCRANIKPMRSFALNNVVLRKTRSPKIWYNCGALTPSRASECTNSPSCGKVNLRCFFRASWCTASRSVINSGQPRGTRSVTTCTNFTNSCGLKIAIRL
mmetsp:Transcript_33473/g.80848  ORF Transcript_33473/g.80848 Transcript_33473/m.80848 type:complete len:221 (+) Transcript_33473:869-1531(+)